MLLLEDSEMLKNPTVDKLKDLKLNIMAQMLCEVDPSMNELTFEDRLGLMVEKEWINKKNNYIQRLLEKATLGLNACMEDIDYSSERSIDKSALQQLSTCLFIEQKLNIIITGKTGSGKSYMACALGNAACRKSYRVKYYRIPELLLDIDSAKTEHRLKKFMFKLQKNQLLILDDIGLKSYSLEESRDILEIAESRYNKGSIIISGQIPHTKWYELFPDPTIADAVMDRIIHNAYLLNLDSVKSMREVIARRKNVNN
jgi:DNA replication protein DnaC